jgi:hypothetical protein
LEFSGYLVVQAPCRLDVVAYGLCQQVLHDSDGKYGVLEVPATAHVRATDVITLKVPAAVNTTQ